MAQNYAKNTNKCQFYVQKPPKKRCERRGILLSRDASLSEVDAGLDVVRDARLVNHGKTIGKWWFNGISWDFIGI